MIEYLVFFINTLSWVLTAALLGRVLLTWIQVGTNSPFYPVIAILYQVTEPILAPIRQVLHRFGLRFGMLDFSPMVALLLLTYLRPLVIDSLR